MIHITQKIAETVVVRRTLNNRQTQV
jgi:hypothetical protein